MHDRSIDRYTVVRVVGTSFTRAAIAFDEDFNTKFVFAEKKSAEKRGNMKRKRISPLNP